ncbi:BAR adaptor protein Hob1, partial [Spiromyces aspiralis]
KGFKKAMGRLPHQVTSKIGKGQKTIDSDYETARDAFKDIEVLLKKVFSDASEFRDGITNSLKFQENFLTLFKEIQEPVRPVKNTNSNNENNGISIVPEHQIAPEVMQALGRLYEQVMNFRQDVQPQMQRMEERVVYPLQEVLGMAKNIRRVMDKREHKLIDYDRFRSAVAKLEAKGLEGGRSVSDEKSYIKNSAQFQEAERQYNYYNDMLKHELEQFFTLVKALMDAVFMSFFRIQQEVYSTMYQMIDAVVRSSPIINANSQPLSRWMERWAAVEGSLNALDLWGNGYMEVKPYQPNRSGGLMGSIGKTFKRTGTSKSSTMDGPTPLPPASGNASTSSAAASPLPYAPHASTSTPPLYGSQPPAYNSVVGDSKIPMPGGSASPPSQYPHQAATTSYHPQQHYGSAFTQSQPPEPRSSPTKYVVALYDYTAQAEGDLSFRENDRIEIIERTDNVNDWWTGRLNGKVGVFPANYVREL